MLELIGGRGRNRTFNLSVKSRMLCQLSYASILLKPCGGNGEARRKAGRISAAHPEENSIPATPFPKARRRSIMRE